MSLMSYRAAPPRVRVFRIGIRGEQVTVWAVWRLFEACVRVVGGPGGDLLSHVLRRSTIGAEGFHGRVRDGIGCGPLAMTTRSTNRPNGAVADAGLSGEDRGCDASDGCMCGAAGLFLR